MTDPNSSNFIDSWIKLATLNVKVSEWFNCIKEGYKKESDLVKFCPTNAGTVTIISIILAFYFCFLSLKFISLSTSIIGIPIIFLSIIQFSAQLDVIATPLESLLTKTLPKAFTGIFGEQNNNVLAYLVLSLLITILLLFLRKLIKITIAGTAYYFIYYFLVSQLETSSLEKVSFSFFNIYSLLSASIVLILFYIYISLSKKIVCGILCFIGVYIALGITSIFISYPVNFENYLNNLPLLEFRQLARNTIFIQHIVLASLCYIIQHIFVGSNKSI